MNLLIFVLSVFGYIIPSTNVVLYMHEFHLSKSMLKYNTEEKAIQISLHLFIDDFELALATKGADSLYLCTKMEKEEADVYIERYIADRLQVMVNDTALNLNFLGKEISEDLAGVWLYLEALEVEKPISLEVTNRLLTEQFDDQRNLMNVSANNKEDYLMFTGEDSVKSITWKQ